MAEGELREPGALRHAQKRAPAQQFLMLDVRTRDGRAYGLPYSYLLSVELDQTSDVDPTLTLSFSTHTVTVSGGRLGSMYVDLLSQRLPGISESPGLGGAIEGAQATRVQVSAV